MDLRWLSAVYDKYLQLRVLNFAEGWNRVAHESFLVGTQVIGPKLGGLGDLLSGANGHIVASMEEAEAIIINQEVQLINYHFLDKFGENVV